MVDGVKHHKRATNGSSPADRPKTGNTGDARRDRWREHRAARRAGFVEAAMRAVAKHGPDLAMEHVAAEAGVTKPVLYRHFTDKADLFVALGQRGTEILFERLLPALSQEEAPLPRIRKSLDAFFSVIEDHPNLYRLLARRSIGDRQVDSDPVREDKEIIASTLSSLLGDYLRSFGMDSGGAEPWAHAIVGMVQNTGEWWLEHRSMSRDAVVEYLTTVIWAAIDGILRQGGVVIEPNRPLVVGNVVALKNSQDPAEAG
jgi:AcrR family transcriptional regulator